MSRDDFAILHSSSGAEIEELTSLGALWVMCLGMELCRRPDLQNLYIRSTYLHLRTCELDFCTCTAAANAQHPPMILFRNLPDLWLMLSNISLMIGWRGLRLWQCMPCFVLCLPWRGPAPLHANTLPNFLRPSRSREVFTHKTLRQALPPNPQQTPPLLSLRLDTHRSL
jgi:hypothetical protein